jgi:hypothetical protein
MPEYCCRQFKKSIDTRGIGGDNINGYYIPSSLEYGGYYPDLNYCPNCGKKLEIKTRKIHENI